MAPALAASRLAAAAVGSTVLMPRRALASAGLEVSVLGLGTVKLGRNQRVKYPHPFHIPTRREAAKLLDRAVHLGINLLDTAPAYGDSEQRLGELLAGRRHDWVLCTKAGEEWRAGASHFDFRPEAIQASVQRSLKRLGTDYLDIVLVHSDGADTHIIHHWGSLEVLAELKRSGLIRAHGMSVKTVSGGLAAASRSDVVMLGYHPRDTTLRAVLDDCTKQGTAVFLKKVLESGWLFPNSNSNSTSTSTSNGTGNSNGAKLQHCMDFIFTHPGVTSAIVGTLNPTHLKENARAAQRAAAPRAYIVGSG